MKKTNKSNQESVTYNIKKLFGMNKKKSKKQNVPAKDYITYKLKIEDVEKKDDAGLKKQFLEKEKDYIYNNPDKPYTKEKFEKNLNYFFKNNPLFSLRTKSFERNDMFNKIINETNKVFEDALKYGENAPKYIEFKKKEKENEIKDKIAKELEKKMEDVIGRYGSVINVSDTIFKNFNDKYDSILKEYNEYEAKTGKKLTSNMINYKKYLDNLAKKIEDENLLNKKKLKDEKILKKIISDLPTKIEAKKKIGSKKLDKLKIEEFKKFIDEKAMSNSIEVVKEIIKNKSLDINDPSVYDDIISELYNEFSKAGSSAASSAGVALPFPSTSPVISTTTSPVSSPSTSTSFFPIPSGSSSKESEIEKLINENDQIEDILKNQTIIKNSVNSKGKYDYMYKCFVCNSEAGKNKNKNITTTSRDNHIKTKKHENNVSELNEKINKNNLEIDRLRDELSKISSSPVIPITPIDTTVEKNKLEKEIDDLELEIKDLETIKNEKINYLDYNIKEENPTDFRCYVCGKNFSTENEAKIHELSKEHIENRYKMGKEVSDINLKIDEIENKIKSLKELKDKLTASGFKKKLRRY